MPEGPRQVLAAALVVFSFVRGVRTPRDPMSMEVSRIAAYAFSALSQIRVDAKEELVVQFGIP